MDYIDNGVNNINIRDKKQEKIKIIEDYIITINQEYKRLIDEIGYLRDIILILNEEVEKIKIK